MMHYDYKRLRVDMAIHGNVSRLVQRAVVASHASVKHGGRPQLFGYDVGATFWKENSLEIAPAASYLVHGLINTFTVCSDSATTGYITEPLAARVAHHSRRSRVVRPDQHRRSGPNRRTGELAASERRAFSRATRLPFAVLESAQSE